MAKADLAAARFAFEGSRASLAAAVADDLFATRGLATQVQAAREALEQTEALAGLVRLQVQSGLKPASDLSRTHVEIAQAQARVIALEADLKAQQRALLVLVGQGTGPLSAR